MTKKTPPLHPLGTEARVLLSSVFGPYAQDDEYGSRRINPMELYHNQVTRVQGVFSLRMFHRSFGLLMMQANMEAPCTVLDFPDLDRFVAELRDHHYDIVGISAIIPNVGKVKKMCELVRTHLPGAVIVVGGHVANLGGLDKMISADHIVRGEGISWFRRFLGQNESAPIKHPHVYSANHTRILGHALADRPGDTAAIVVPSVGCPMGCNFCSTSALFGGKGNFVDFYETGDELFAVMKELEEKLKVQSFFILDENFLFHRRRALRFLELLAEHGKSWSLYVFSSARVLRSYTMEQLVALGISWVWMGLEGENSRYTKLSGVDTRALVQDLKSHGIRVLGSSIIGLEEHRPEDMEGIIDHAVSHETDFHQFMIYTANPGTPLHDEMKQAGTLLTEKEFALADAHGQYRFNHRHAHIRDHQEEQIILSAFARDFEQNGPSLFRMIKTLLTGWERYRNHPEKRIRDRYAREVQPLRSTYVGGIWAMRKWYRNNKAMTDKMDTLLADIYAIFGWSTRLAAPIYGRYLHRAMKREEKLLATGWRPEPTTFYEKNPAALALEQEVPYPVRRRNPVGIVTATKLAKGMEIPKEKWA